MWRHIVAPAEPNVYSNSLYFDPALRRSATFRGQKDWMQIAAELAGFPAPPPDVRWRLCPTVHLLKVFAAAPPGGIAPR
jgi:hypothetical protein